MAPEQITSSASNIEEGWQDVDDTCSVRSLPSSSDDGELVELSDSEHDIGNADGADEPSDLANSTDLNKSTTTLKGQVPYRPAPADNTAVEVEDTGVPAPTVPPSSSTPEHRLDTTPTQQSSPIKPINAKDASIISQSSNQSEASTGHQSEVESFSDSLTLLCTQLKDVLRLVNGQQFLSFTFQTGQIRAILQALDEQLKEILPIVLACANYAGNQKQNPYFSVADLPFDQSLPAWTKDLQTTLLGFQVQMDTQLQVHHQRGYMCAVSLGNVCAKAADKLESLHVTMTEFLPIIRADYNEFRTESMSMPTSPTPIPGRQRRGGVDPTVSTLRQSCYRMRDETQKVLDLLIATHTFDLSSPIAKDAPATIKSLANLRDALMLILTNNPSEWIESDLNDQRMIISYPTFIALSPDLLDDLTSNLGQLREDLDVPVDKENTRGIVYRHQLALLAEGGQLKEIHSTVSFLESLLIPAK